jgi:hypothetical protein
MAAFDSTLWRRLSPILDVALELPTEQRAGFVARACEGDAELQAAAQWMLEAVDAEFSVLERPVEIPPELRPRLPDRSPRPLAPGRFSPSSSREAPGAGERFLPGTLVAGRYRIVSLLGRGGMGEVYRADDLTLRQQVALKFLPAELQRDPALVQRVVQEVRTARQISHPNVCRVWDVGEHDGSMFFSMEYVDGESLAALLKRIGRLPIDKAIDVAQQLCAGLAAAHDQRILHRDLKPANIMLDGRGQVRIADFGIASVAGDARGLETIAGTPGYMAPEQLAGRELGVRADLYSLGAVLYEIFTGRRAFEASTLAELQRLQEESFPPKASRLVDGLDPAIERVITRCLARDPDDRPSSARTVAAALPGSDPIEAALAAGETPSPELVAAAESRHVLSPRAVVAIGAAWLIALALLVASFEQTSLLGRVPFTQPLPVLAAHAREILASLDDARPPLDAVYDLANNQSYLQWLAARDTSPRRWDPLSARGSLGIWFWYRESAGYVAPHTGFPQPLDPPLESGDALVITDLRGRLRLLHAIPPEADFSTEPRVAPDWSLLFAAAGLASTDFAPVQPTRVPHAGFDARAAWSGILRDAGDLPIRVEAAAWRGQPVYFECIYPSDPYWSPGGTERPPATDRLSPRLWTAWMLVLLAIGGLLVVRNLRLGRGDRRGAFRLAALACAGRLLVWLLGGHHVPVFWEELRLLTVAVARGLFVAAVVWSLYIAFEPTVRRLWPRRLVGWSRLLAGRWRDPVVGRDILVGSLAGLLLLVLWSQLPLRLSEWLGTSHPPRPLPFPGPALYVPKPDTLLGGRFVVAGLAAALLGALYGTLAMTVFLLGWRLALRKDALAAMGFVAFATLQSWPAALSGYSWTGLTGGLLGAVMMTTLYLRLGVLAVAVALVATFVYSLYPMTADVSAPYFGTGLVAVLALAALTGYGAVTALGGRRLFS